MTVRARILGQVEVDRPVHLVVLRPKMCNVALRPFGHDLVEVVALAGQAVAPVVAPVVDVVVAPVAVVPVAVAAQAVADVEAEGDDHARG